MAEGAPKFIPQDNWAVQLFQKHGLGKGASLEEVEAEATRLLASPLTALSGAELVLGRRIDGGEKDLATVFYGFGLSAEEKFALLLMEKETEKNIAEAKTKGTR